MSPVETIMYAPLVIAAFFLIGVIANIVSGDRAEALAGAGIVALLCLFARFVHREETATARLLKWAAYNHDRLEETPGVYETRPVGLDTVFTRYRVTFGCLLCSFEYESRPLPVAEMHHWSKWAQCTLMTLIFGWWELPYGPFRTIKALFRNLRGGQRRTLEQMLAKAVEEAREREEKRRTSWLRRAFGVGPIDDNS